MNQIVRFSDVTARDGLQSLSKVISPSNRIRLINSLKKLKFNEIEVGSIVNPKVIPTMANSLDVYKSTLDDSTKSYLLIGNNHGIDVINKNKIKHFSLFSSPSDSFNKANINVNVKQSFERFQNMLFNLDKMSNHHIKGYISCISDCPFEGDVPVKNILKTIYFYSYLGVDEICIADTIGTLQPSKLEKILKQSSRFFDHDKLSLHLHTNNETISQGITKNNLKVAVENGIFKFDTSLFGIGGCPAVYNKNNTAKSGNLDVKDAIKYLSEFGCEFSEDYTSDSWNRQLQDVEETFRPIIF